MKYIKLNTDAEMPIIGLGTWRSEPGEVYQSIRWAIKLGYKHIDCASVYENQKEIGQAIHDAIKEGDIKREELFVVSKLWNDSHAPENVRPAVEQTLEDLQLDYLDLYLVHWPVAQKKGTILPVKDEDWIPLKELPLELTWAEMEKLYNDGVVKAIGVSNFSAQKIGNLIEKAEIVPIYLTVTGLGEGKDMENRELLVEENDTVAEIFSLKYPEIYEEFQQPLVMNNVFQSFNGVRST